MALTILGQALYQQEPSHIRVVRTRAHSSVGHFGSDLEVGVRTRQHQDILGNPLGGVGFGGVTETLDARSTELAVGVKLAHPQKDYCLPVPDLVVVGTV